MSSSTPHAPSYWAGTTRHLTAFPPLTGDADTEVAILGGGFTGLSAAHHLHLAGRACLVLEAKRIGWGASGRNGGMAVPRYKLTFPELERAYGRETALLMYRLAHEGVDTLEAIVGEHGLECGFQRCGHITPIQRAADLPRFEEDVAWLSTHATDRTPGMLDRGELERRLGTAFYSGGYFEPRGAGIHPLEYCQSLATALAARGVGMHEHTPVLDWQDEGDHVLLRTANGRIRARHLVIAANAYVDQTAAGDALKRRVVPVASALIATAPLPPALRATIMTGGNLATDAKRLTNYYRLMPDGRFVFGGRGGASSQAGERVYRRLVRDMVEIFPALRGIPLDFCWYGLVAATLDFLPRIGQLSPRVSYAMGYNGRGVALAAVLGARLAGWALQERPRLGPISDGAFEPIPFHALRVPAKQVAITWMQLRDRLGF